MDINGLDHSLPVTYPSSIEVQEWLTVAQGGDVGGGATHIDHEDVVHISQIARADHAGRRAGQDGLYRSFQCHLGINKRAITLHDHQRSIDTLAG